ncbi:MAG: EI24 domain-containing protein [Rhodospirillales bacterium]|nr:EI24 domain-containing protein [Rhodospirillales bacterium]
MLAAFFNSIAQFSDPAVRKVVWKSIGAALVALVLLWIGIGFLLTETALFTWGWLETAVDVLGGLATFVLTLLLFPAVSSVAMGFFADEVAVAVENKHYPSLSPVRDQPISEVLSTTAKFSGIAILLNLIALPLYLIPVVNLAVFYILNGYLLSREYFEMVAFRRADSLDVSAMRAKFKIPLFLSGIVIAFLMTIPVINLLAPVIATATMVHLFHKWRGQDLPVDLPA